MMMISLIAILTANHVIGRSSTIPWYFAIDMHWFKNHTLYKPIIMGRKTFESIGKVPLSDRLNIVLSKNRLLCNQYNNIVIVDNPDDALSVMKESTKEIMIIGGHSVYNIFINQCSRMYLTYINLIYDYGDVWFPFYDKSQWKPVFDVCTENYVYNTRYFNLNFKILERHLY